MAVDYTTTVDGKDYGFDFEDTRIDIDATVASLDVEDLYTAIKDAQASIVGIAYETIANGEGLATLSTGIQTFLTVTLLTTWEVNTLKTSGKFEVRGGNLIRQDGADPFRDNPLITYIAFLSQAGVLATGSGGSTVADNPTLFIEEWGGSVKGPIGDVEGAAKHRKAKTQLVIGSSSVRTSFDFDTEARYIIITTNADAQFEIGDSTVTATSGSYFIPSGATRKIGLEESDKRIAVIESQIT
jgi:hypothetical protein